jgi:FAD synthase
VEFVKYLRPEQKFDDTGALTRQMHADAEQARSALDLKPDS